MVDALNEVPFSHGSGTDPVISSSWAADATMSTPVAVLAWGPSPIPEKVHFQTGISQTTLERLVGLFSKK